LNHLSRFAGIDIGSNAVRLLIGNIIQKDNETYFKKGALIRIPVRLGSDVFSTGEISKENIILLSETMLGFKHLMNAHQVIHYKALATAAMREAKNAKQVAKQIKDNTDIQIEVIDGKTEANILYQLEKENNYAHQDYLFVDVGGGSTEITLFQGGQVVFSKSFKVGTLRLMHSPLDKTEWDKMKQFLKSGVAPGDVVIVGSGGNINKVFKMANAEKDDSLSYRYLKTLLEELQSMEYVERILQFDLNPDRADVILPALEIFTKIMKWTGINEVFVPKMGLSDGIVRLAYDEYWNKR
jgi:exopolyphosphatase/guanosine-5'-triphosphate,3'-diphosphate pyrophosphatase